MKVVRKTDEYTIVEKRSKRYGVLNAKKNWINGDAKTTILVNEKLLEVAVPKPKEAEAEEVASDEVASEESATEEPGA